MSGFEVSILVWCSNPAEHALKQCVCSCFKSAITQCLNSQRRESFRLNSPKRPLQRPHLCSHLSLPGSKVASSSSIRDRVSWCIFPESVKWGAGANCSNWARLASQLPLPENFGLTGTQCRTPPSLFALMKSLWTTGRAKQQTAQPELPTHPKYPKQPWQNLNRTQSITT